MRAWLFRCLLAASFLLSLPLARVSGQEKSSTLQALLDRAADYVAAYEDRELGNVLAFETYLQNVTSYGRSRFVSPPQRRTESDFLIVLVGSDRMGIRRVNRVNGEPVKSAEANLEALKDDSPEGIRKRIDALREESARYNIGPILRHINLPTFALKVLRREEAPRFSFVQRGAGKVNGIQGIEVRFQEQRAPTLVHGGKGESLLSSGAVWIEPGTGRVLKTEFNVENPYSDAKGRVTVTYSMSKSLGILVPDDMKEHYESENGVVDCTANYSRFRSFAVDLKSEISAARKR